MKIGNFLTKSFVGLSYGISFPITLVILDYWLKDCGVSNTVIGIFSLLHCPFTLKFLWAPIIDHHDIPYISKKLKKLCDFGRRRSWVVSSQFFLILGVLGMAHCEPKNGLTGVIFFSSMVAFADGCQNIALYSYQIHKSKEEHFGYVASAVSLGHRIGTIFTKVITLYLAHFFSWKMAYLGAAFLLFICMVFFFFIEEPEGQATLGRQTYFSDILEFLKKDRILEIFTILVLYKSTDFLMQKMSRPFCIELGFSKAEIANVVQLFGSVSAIVGGIGGGYLVKKIGNMKAMLYCGMAHVVSMYSYLFLSKIGYNVVALCSVVFLEDITRGSASAAFIAFFYSLCRTGTQYALMWAIHEASRLIFSAISGFFVDAVGWSTFFILAPLSSIPCLLILRRKILNEAVA